MFKTISKELERVLYYYSDDITVEILKDAHMVLSDSNLFNDKESLETIEALEIVLAYFGEPVETEEDYAN